MLMHHAYARGIGVVGRPEPHLVPIDENLPLVGLIKTHEDVHERRLARAVLANQGERLALAYAERYGIAGERSGEALGDALYSQLGDAVRVLCHLLLSG